MILMGKQHTQQCSQDKTLKGKTAQREILRINEINPKNYADMFPLLP